MKNLQQNLFQLVVFMISFHVFSQNTFYNKNAEDIPVIGQESYLMFDKPASIKSDTKSIGFDDFLNNNLTSFINLGYKIIQNQIEKDQKKYTDSFSVRRTYLFQEPIHGFRIKRDIVNRNNKERENAFNAHFKVQKLMKNTMVFQIDELKTNLSGAKVWQKTNFNTYDIKIFMSYFSDGKMNVQEFKNIKIPLVEIGNQNSVQIKDENGDYKYGTDIFVIPNEFVLLEINVLIDETSASKYKAERVKSIKDYYSTDIKEVTDKLIQFLQNERLRKKQEKEGSE